MPARAIHHVRPMARSLIVSTSTAARGGLAAQLNGHSESCEDREDDHGESDATNDACDGD
jgi:hypothetical protein